MSIKKEILKKNEGGEIEKDEFTNLIMDDMQIGEISAEDKEFLEGFKETCFLSLNSTGLKSIENMPAMPKLQRLELCDNKLSGSVAPLVALYPNLQVLKLSNNQFKTIETAEITSLKNLEHLQSLDLSKNPLVEALGTEYQQTLRKLLITLDEFEVLDSLNKDGEEVVSDDDDEGDEDDSDAASD